MYLFLKHLHLTFVALAFLIFLTRGFWLITGSPLINRKWAKIAPHAANGIMLISGVALAIYLQISPLAASWLSAKLIAIVLFIGLGVATIKAPSKKLRISFFILSALCFIQILLIATTKNPFGIL